MRCGARDRAPRPKANPASEPSAPVTPDGQKPSLAGTLRVAQLHAPVKCGKAAIAGRLVEHRVALGGVGKRLRVAFLFHFERVESGAQHEYELVAQHLSGGAQFAAKTIAFPQQPRLAVGAAAAGTLWFSRRIARHRTGVARPVRIHAARRIRRVRSEKGKRRGGVYQHRQALLGVLPADRRWPPYRTSPAHAVAPLGECQPVTASAHQVLPERTARSPDLPSAEGLDRALRNASPADVIAAALQAVGREHLAVVSSFGTESVSYTH